MNFSNTARVRPSGKWNRLDNHIRAEGKLNEGATFYFTL
jgi:hypothetical protein